MYIERKEYGNKSKDSLTSILSASENTYKSITAVFGEKMALFDDINVANVTSNSDFDFDFGFDSFSIHQSESNQNEYLALFSNLSFSHNNIYIFKNLDIKSSRIKGFLNISVPYFKVDLIEKNFQKLDELKYFLQSASLLSQKAPLRLKNINVKLDGIDVSSDLLKNTIALKKSEIFYVENQNKSELKSNVSCIEIGFIVIKNLIFELNTYIFYQLCKEFLVSSSNKLQKVQLQEDIVILNYYILVQIYCILKYLWLISDQN